MTPDNAVVVFFIGLSALSALALFDVYLSRRTDKAIIDLERRVDASRAKIFGVVATFETALCEIASQDDTEMALDPQWAKRVAVNALKAARTPHDD